MNKRIVILGGGESGVGSAILAKAKGFDVFVSDFGHIKQNYKDELTEYNILWEEEQHTDSLILDAFQVIKSPGIPSNAPIIKKCLQNNIPVYSEIEFAGKFCEGKTICITGSNGKTTTTSLIFDILYNAGKDVAMVGNIGSSFARQVALDPKEFYVIEVSSFQLDDTYTFKPDVSVLLNITPDHLDRYEYSLEKYADSKMKICQSQDSNDYFVFCKDDELTDKKVAAITSNVNLMPFSTITKDGVAAYIEDKEMIIRTNNTEMNMLIDELALQGQHNTYNSMAASVAARVLDIRDDFIRRSLASFKGVEHRLEKYLQIRDVQFINDSKATNINSTWYALDSVKGGIVWIAGGVDKGNDYSALDNLVKEKVKGIVCLGVNNEKLTSHFGKNMEMIVEANNMQEAVNYAFRMADKGDTVLLSPACASFDLFENYEDRGNQFKNCVRNL
jgi:UDP-N-acetylmuramoylalanine--D-glutamate ligase